MKKGLLPGLTRESGFMATPEMQPAKKDGTLIHPLYSTWSMVRHFEMVGRELLEPYLDPDEEAVGYRISVTHSAPSPVGKAVRVRVCLKLVKKNHVVCGLEAYNEAGKIGEGRFTQVVLTKSKLNAKIRRATGGLE